MKKTPTPCVLGAILIVLSFGAEMARGQAMNEITEVTPDAATPDTTGLLVTFTLDTDVPPAPPAGVMPDSVTIGSMTGASVTHSSQYVVTAVFDIPAGASAGTKDVIITFTTPDGSLVYSLTGGFTVTAGAGTPPSISQHPQSRTAPLGSTVTFNVAASGSEPLSYQWQKDAADVPGATDSSYVLEDVSYEDEGQYACVVWNDNGTVTSNAAPLTINALSAAAYPIVDTGQDICYDDVAAITCPAVDQAFYGQDAQIHGNQPSYTLSGDGLTVFDNVTGLTWTKSPDLNGDGVIDVNDKLSFTDARIYADTVLNPQAFGGYFDWRLPTMKELYSLMDFRGTDPDPTATSTSALTPFIDTNYFDFAYGDTTAGERIIDSQFWSGNAYVGFVFGDQPAAFGLNLADGRIKGYPSGSDGPVTKLNFVYFVRGNPDYGINDFVDNGDGTITDHATGLMWSQDDSGMGMIWEDALAYVEQKNAENYRGHNDWKLPNAKEMQSIVDYARSPDTTNSAAIDPIFNTTVITNEAGELDYPFFWTGTTHQRFDGSGSGGVYLCFGRGLGTMDNVNIIDVHGAGCQRSDPKDGDPNDYPSWGNGPQGDVRRVWNYVRLVRDTDSSVDLSITKWSSVKTHASHGDLAIELDPAVAGGSCEPRRGGADRIEVQLTGDVSSLLASSASAVDAAYGNTIDATSQYTTGNGSVLVLEFENGLTTGGCYLIDLAGVVTGLTGDTDCVFRCLEGNINQDGEVNLIDAAECKQRNGSSPADAAFVGYDLNMDGNINLIDFGEIKLRSATTAACE